MITRNLIFILVSLLIFSTCKKEEPATEENQRIVYGTGDVDFSNLKVGQKTSYERQVGICQAVTDSLFSIPPPIIDTLYLEVIDMNFDTVLFSERFSEGSFFYQNGATDAFTYDVITKDNFILIPERDNSPLFYFYANDTLQLQPSNAIELTQQFCTLLTSDSTFIGNDIGTVEEFIFFDKMLENQYAVSCLPSVLAVEDGYLIYDRNGLNVSFTVSEPNTISGISTVESWKKVN